jgi:hypothetical protein
MAGENLTLIEKLLTEARENLNKALKFLQKNAKNPSGGADRNCGKKLQ